MNKQTKHYLYVGIVLASIGVVVSAAIVGVNYLTKDKIAENQKILKDYARREVFPDCEFDEEVSIKNEEYLLSYCTGYKNDKEFGDVYYTSGKNMYGAISMMIGIYTSGELGHISLVQNTQSFASTVFDNYVTPYNQNPSSSKLDDVKCGATYGAKLIREMALKAQSHYKERKGIN